MAIPRAQELTELISFRNVTVPYSAVGGGTQGETFASAFARITEGTGEIEATDQQHQVQTQAFEIWTQYLEGITGFMEIIWGTRTLVITDAPQKVLDRFGREWLLIHAEETIERSL